MIWHDVEQNSEQWNALRLGRFTASMFGDLFSKENTAAFREAWGRVYWERKYGVKPSDIKDFKTSLMERGHEMEIYAREWYESQNFIKVKNGGFCELSEWIGASPDGLVGEDGGIEIKSIKYTTFIEWDKKRDYIPAEHIKQVQGCLYVTGRKWWDFIGFHPDVKDSNIVVRAYPDEKIFKEIEEKLTYAINIVKSHL